MTAIRKYTRPGMTRDELEGALERALAENDRARQILTVVGHLQAGDDELVRDLRVAVDKFRLRFCRPAPAPAPKAKKTISSAEAFDRLVEMRGRLWWNPHGGGFWMCASGNPGEERHDSFGSDPRVAVEKCSELWVRAGSKRSEPYETYPPEPDNSDGGAA